MLFQHPAKHVLGKRILASDCERKQRRTMIPTVEWKDGAVRLLDQSRLPEHVEFLDCRDYQTVAAAIRELRVRGAPAIGVTAAMGVALGAQAVETTDYDAFSKAVDTICDHLAAT